MIQNLDYYTTTPKIIEVDNQLEEDTLSTDPPNQNSALPLISQSQKTLYTGRQTTDQHLFVANQIKQDAINLHINQQISSLTPLHQIQCQSVQAKQAQQKPLSPTLKQIQLTQQLKKYFEAKLNGQRFDHQNAVISLSIKIKNQILNGDMHISPKIRDLQFTKQNSEVNQMQMIRQLQQKKWETIQKLKDIQQDQANLYSHITKPTQRGRSLLHSVTTPEPTQKIANLLKKTRAFQQKQRQKSVEFVSSVQETKKRQQEQLQLQRLRENQKKKQKIIINLQEIQKQQKEREQVINSSILKKNHRYAHVKLLNQMQQRQKQQQKQVQNKLQQIHLKNQLNIEQIKEHDRNYSMSLQQRTARSKSPKSSTLSRVARLKRQKTYYDRLVEEELFEIKQKNYQQIMKVRQHNFKQKIEQFQQKVLQEYKPVVDPAKRITVVPRSYSSVSLSNELRNEKGLQYLAKAKKMKRCASEVEPKPSAIEPLSGNKIYKDYMKDRQRVNLDPLQKQFNEIINSKQQSQKYQSILRAKYLAEGLEAKSKKPNDDKLFSAIQKKLSLLQKLY